MISETKNLNFQLSHVDLMGDDEFDTLFNHYDKTGQGFIDSESALFALISDMMRRHGGEISAHELQRVRKAVLAVCDSGFTFIALQYDDINVITILTAFIVLFF